MVLPPCACPSPTKRHVKSLSIKKAGGQKAKKNVCETTITSFKSPRIGASNAPALSWEQPTHGDCSSPLAQMQKLGQKVKTDKTCNEKGSQFFHQFHSQELLEGSSRDAATRSPHSCPGLDVGLSVRRSRLRMHLHIGFFGTHENGS